MYEITRWFDIDTGHRLINHSGKCAHLHGHRYRIGIVCQSAGLDQVGVVVDFGEVKEVIGGWLEAEWDHGLVLETGDPLGEAVKRADIGSKVFWLPVPPSAENLAKYLFDQPWALPRGIQVSEVVVWETPNCCARWKAVSLITSAVAATR